MGYPSYASNGACTLHSSSAFHYVMAEIVLAVQLVNMLKVASGTDARTVISRIFFGLMGYYYFVYLWGYAARAARSAIIALWRIFS